MDKPTLNLTEIEHPTGISRDPASNVLSDETLGGYLRVQSLYRKYVYQLTYDAITYENYKIIENIVNDIIDSDNQLTYIYDKHDTSESPGVIVYPNLSAWEKVGGQGTEYYGKCTLTLTEVLAR